LTEKSLLYTEIKRAVKYRIFDVSLTSRTWYIAEKAHICDKCSKFSNSCSASSSPCFSIEDAYNYGFWGNPRGQEKRLTFIFYMSINLMIKNLSENDLSQKTLQLGLGITGVEGGRG
jgi:hypothetical protein